MKILHLISSGGMYGAEAVILALSRCLNAAGHESSIAAFTSESQPNLALRAAADDAGIRIDSIACAGQIDRQVPAAIRALAQTLGSEVVHMHGYKADVYGWLALRGAGLPLVSSCHTWYDNDLFLRVYGLVDRWVLRRFAGVVAVSEEVRQRLLRSGTKPDRVRLIYNGIDPSPFANIEPGTCGGVLRVGLVGRLASEKGVDLFLKAAARVLKVLPETEFVVAGEGPDRAKLEALVQDLGLASNLRLAGRTDDMPAFYQSLDLLVSSSRQEGLPIALLEAMASGLPLVATQVGEVPRLVQHGVSGLLVPPEEFEALAEAIATLLRDREARTALGRAARETHSRELLRRTDERRLPASLQGCDRSIASTVFRKGRRNVIELRPQPIAPTEVTADRIFMMDLWATVPYYTAYLCRALQQKPALPCRWVRSPITLTPSASGAEDLQASAWPSRCRRALQPARLAHTPSLETARKHCDRTWPCLRSSFWCGRPDIIHIQYLPLLRWLPGGTMVFAPLPLAGFEAGAYGARPAAARYCRALSAKSSTELYHRRGRT